MKREFAATCFTAFLCVVVCKQVSPLCLQGQRAINSKDSACFWWTLYVVVSLGPIPHLHYAICDIRAILGSCWINPSKRSNVVPVCHHLTLSVLAALDLAGAGHHSDCKVEDRWVTSSRPAKHWVDAHLLRHVCPHARALPDSYAVSLRILCA